MQAVKISKKSEPVSNCPLLMELNRYFKPSAVALIFLSSNCFADSSFNPAFLEKMGGDGTAIDLSVFSSPTGGQLPGKYIVDIYINDELADHREVEFIADKSTSGKDKNGTKNNEEITGLIPCLTLEDLKGYGLRTDAIEAFNKNSEDKSAAEQVDNAKAKVNSPAVEGACSNILQSIPAAKADFDFNKQRLNLSIPQALMSHSARGYVDPKFWDDGITAALIDYNFTGANGTSSGDNSKDDSYYLNLRSGLNLGAWRLRNYSAWNDNNGVREWQNINTYLQRSIISIKSQLILGDNYSSADIFDSSQFRGIQIASDDDMLPDSQQGFAPIVRGIAKTNAQVTITQNGYTIYQSYVSPGAFEINDLYPSAGSGDLTVVIKEQDGSQQTFIQPYASVPMLQREGHTKYSLTAGQYRSGYSQSKPNFGQFTLIQGLSHGATVYGGVQASENYMAAAAGIGQNLGDLGAVSIDITQAKTDLTDSGVSKGQSYRFLYAKTFADSGTDLRLMGYRYSTSGFYTLQESVDLNDDDNTLSEYDVRTHKRSRVEGSINQTLPENWGSLFFSASVQDYWDDSAKEQTLQWGYNNDWKGISYNIAVSDNYITEEERDRQFSLNVSIPLDKWLSSASVSYNSTSDSDGRVQRQTSLSGTLLEDRNLTYNISQGVGNQGQGYSGNTSLSYQGKYGNSNVGYSYTKDSRRLNYGLQGGIITHSDGITFSEPLGETVALVAAPGAGDTKVKNKNGVRTDDEGYAVLPYITAYRHNNVSLDTTSLGKNVEIDESVRDVIPTRGAVVRAKFTTHVGYRMMMMMMRPSGKPVPFGTTVSLLDATSAGIVGEDGEAYLSGLPAKGSLKAQWGKGADEHCIVHYQVNEKQAAEETLMTLQAKCLPD
ncbi:MULTISPECIES: fimbria/pilus outer membrane usher protein [Hafnia]|jgi:outer membrane usher protein|uniref:Outer membrane usher protein fimD n=2 Tax=Hafnia alvei TaxID=569 RepID=A0A377PCD2_HAFAL|nr:fimbria/pilus outer membrane usher protein [Hafnia alvei]MCV9376857.1 fimbrial biogenesis outer membrane usher protein [Hafnia alvei]MDX6846575.1 fimbria/pilus outer membrane usher protein [Hafnia alvei]RLR07195.1 fimbrial biogenesis outer membrane usher protein [Hafnia alvei ATCC 13337]WQD25735.1 fimbria/pilus outer membrane usher protein [Hafnia alvei]STQ78458.1 Outer membrane usher protein fimD precursor [Hafnia alvei]